MSPVRVQPVSPGCCLLSLLLLPFNILFIPLNFLITPRQERYNDYNDPNQNDRWDRL